jgi:hypothetical protein
MLKINNFITIIIISLFVFLSTSFANENTSIQSGDKDECKIFIKQSSKDVYQEVKCTSELKYPEPTYGYDKKHCIFYRTDRYGRYIGKTNGLYCSMNGYDQNSKWYYVK